MAEMLASLDDINAELPSDVDDVVVEATEENTSLLQINAARIVRGYLARIIDNVILQSWRTPETTPDTVRIIAAKLIAGQLFFNKVAAQSTDISERNVSQLKYNEAMALLNQVISGDLVIENVDVKATDRMQIGNFFPVDDTDRAFTMSKLL